MDTHRDIALRTCIGALLQAAEPTLQRIYDKMAYRMVGSGKLRKCTLGQAFQNNFESHIVKLGHRWSHCLINDQEAAC